jgi:hypothetical protein
MSCRDRIGLALDCVDSRLATGGGRGSEEGTRVGLVPLTAWIYDRLATVEFATGRRSRMRLVRTEHRTERQESGAPSPQRHIVQISLE